MTHRLAAWDRFTDPAFWWMYTMVLVWAIFTIVSFIAEPLFLHRWSLLSRSWSNLDAVWAASLILVGIVGLLTAL